MINKFLIIISILFLCISCENRISFKKKEHIFYADKDVNISIELISKKKIEQQKNGAYRYFYYGTMTSQLLSDNNPKEARLIYKNEESAIYLDSIADAYIWNRQWWDQNGFRKNKIYVAFDDSNIDWNEVKIINIPQQQKMSIKTACSLVSEESEAAKICKDLKKTDNKK